MVELFEQDLNDDGRRSSKGNQLKWKHDQLWYKADYLGYEGLSEYIISKEQLDIAETFYGQNIKFTWQMNDVDAFLQDANLYSIEIRDRVRSLLAEQKRKYAYLFINQ